MCKLKIFYIQVVVIIGLSIFTLDAAAMNDSGGYHVKGFGAKSCGSFVSAYEGQRQDNFAFLSWLQGFFSGYNYFNQDGVSDVAQTDIYGLEQWILNYCRSQPTRDVSIAAIAFVKAHQNSAKR